VLRLAAILGGLVGVLIVPLALVAPTSILLIPAHLGFALLATFGAVGEAVVARPERSRIWGLWFLVASIAMVAALQFGSQVDGRAYWMLPWIAALAWGWIPPVVAGIAGWGGDALRERRTRQVVRARHRQVGNSAT
jgi:hypothetical protein